jgi:hypothetical protein
MSSVVPPVRASCGCVVLAMFSFQIGVAVAMPRDPTKEEIPVEVESNDPTVNCDVVAISEVPAEFETMMELAGNDPPRLESDRQV